MDRQHRIQGRQDTDAGDAVRPGSPRFLSLPAKGDIHAGGFLIVKHVLPVHLVVPFISQCLEAIPFARNTLFPVVDARVVECDKGIAIR